LNATSIAAVAVTCEAFGWPESAAKIVRKDVTVDLTADRCRSPPIVISSSSSVCPFHSAGRLSPRHAIADAERARTG